MGKISPWVGGRAQTMRKNINGNITVHVNFMKKDFIMETNLQIITACIFFVLYIFSQKKQVWRYEAFDVERCKTGGAPGRCLVFFNILTIINVNTLTTQLLRERTFQKLFEVQDYFHIHFTFCRTSFWTIHPGTWKNQQM